MIQKKAANANNQNRIFAIGFVLIVLVVVWALAKPAVLRLAAGDENSEKKVNEEIMKAPMITAEELFAKLGNKEKMIVTDIRSADDFAKGHIAASANLVPASVNKQNLQSLEADANSSIVVLNKGEDVLESARKTNELIAAGFKNTKYLQGGISAWMIKGYTLVSGGAAPIDNGKIKKVSVQQLISDLSSGTDIVQFVDLRDKSIFQSGHIPGAINLPLADLEKDQSKISPIKKVVIYGKDDGASNQAAVALFDFNFFSVYVLDGGLDAWKAAGGKLE